MGQQGRRGPRLLGDKKNQRMLATMLPIVVADAVKVAAAANYESPAAYIRRIVVERLRADGALPKVVPVEGAGV